MKISKLFTKTSKSFPKDEVSVSSQLLIRAGYIDKVSAGVYTILPLGLKVLNNICSIIRLEMDAISGQEVLMPTLVPKENWVKTGRWDGLDVLFKLEGQDEKEYGLGASHEEIVSPLARKYTLSYKDLPFAVYQIQNKFRDELRAKSGLLRTREFLMKDLYSFHSNSDDLDNYYEKVTQAYWNIFEKVGIKEKTHFTYASGGTFSKYSHEFQTETEAGEDEIYICKECSMAHNKEIVGDNFECEKCKSNEYDLVKGIEVGNIFKLMTKYSDPFELTYIDKEDNKQPVIMGCYGIGVQRLMGAIVEVNQTQKGLNWPESVSPYKYHLISLDGTEDEASKIYEELLAKGESVLYDDRKISAGEKFTDQELIGIPNRLVISSRNNGKIEFTKQSLEPKLIDSIKDL